MGPDLPWWPHRLERFRCRLRLLSVQSPQGGTGVLPVQLFVPHPDPATASCLRRAAPAPSLRSWLGAALGVGLRAGAALRGQTALPVVLIAAISCPFGRISESPADHGNPSRRSCSPAAARVRHAGRRWSAHGASFARGVRSSVVWAAGPSPAQRATTPPPAICRRFHVGNAVLMTLRASSDVAREPPQPVCCFLLSLLAAGTGQRRKKSYEGPHGSGSSAHRKTSRRRKVSPKCRFSSLETPRKCQFAQRVSGT